MAAITDYYNYIFHDVPDKRTNDYFLGDSPIYVTGLLIAYYYFIYGFGPRFMSNRPAFNIDRIVIAYNVAQIIMNAYLFINASFQLKNLNIACGVVDYNNGPLVNTAWLYFINKVLDLLDTVFFVLRKKQVQITFLHVYHHIVMVMGAWLGFKYAGGGHTVYFGLMNTAVHTIMYFYYLLSIYNPEFKKSIWWKKYITQIQLLQFVGIFVVFSPLVFKTDCSYPKFFSIVFTTQSVVMLYLFGKFYYGAYIKPKKSVVTNNKKSA